MRACAARAIRRGTLTSEKFLLNGARTYLFRDYDMAVAEWWKPEGYVLPAAVLSVAGGSVEVAGVMITTSGMSLDVGRQYVFFLQEIPNGDSCWPQGPPVEIREGRLVLPADWPPPGDADHGVSIERFGSDIAAILQTCSAPPQPASEPVAQRHGDDDHGVRHLDAGPAGLDEAEHLDQWQHRALFRERPEASVVPADDAFA